LDSCGGQGEHSASRNIVTTQHSGNALQQVWGPNSLYCESAPGAADFAPFVARRGQFVQFYGNQAVHYTVPNTTDSTRVSFDIRVVPLPLFAPEWMSPKGTVPFRLGQYYRSTEVHHTT
jgi:hypothetical protein